MPPPTPNPTFTPQPTSIYNPMVTPTPTDTGVIIPDPTPEPTATYGFYGGTPTPTAT